MPTDITKQVRSYLVSLGAGPNKVAETLKKKRIKGSVGEWDACPIAVALQKKFKSLEEMRVDYDEVTFEYKDEKYSVSTPAACKKFMERLDSGDEYQNLLA
jgi:hypothetical protein